MLKDLTLKGLLLGFSTGILVTLFDGLYMLSPNTYVPVSYPVLLLVFNTLFWMTVGGVSGFAQWAFVRNNKGRQEKEAYYRVLFFLLPFALIYGFLGRLYITQFFTAHPVVFDRHLSFLWVSVIMAFLIFYFKKRLPEKHNISTLFTLEILTFILLFQYCSNIIHIEKIFPISFFKYLEFIKDIFKLGWIQHLIVIYITGVSIIIGFYFISFYTTMRLRTKGPPGSPYPVAAILFVFVAITLAGIFSWNHNKNANKNIFPVNSSRDIEAERIPSVILIILDTVRADRLTVYGNPGATKNLEAFSSDALVFENCVASSSWTQPSHASLFTGLYPREHGSHGILDSNKYKWFNFKARPRPLSDEFTTLAEIFRENGYQTAAVVANGVLAASEKSKGLNIHQGFQAYDCMANIGQGYLLYPFRPIIHLFCYLTHIYSKYTLLYITADDVNEKSFRLINKLAHSPFFLFMNYMDAHSPYNPPRPFNGSGLKTRFPHVYRLKQYLLRGLNQMNNKEWYTYQISQYDGELAFLDYSLGEFFAYLKQKGLYDSSLIIITSDHGELFDEHGLSGHQVPMYEGAVKVPLMIKFPFSSKVGREMKMITLSDLYPTILSICGILIPNNISGKTFGDGPSPVISELYEYATGKHRTVYNGKYKYMRYEYKKSHELYNLEEDPNELDNLAEKLPDITAGMQKKLRDWEKAHTPRYTPSKKKEETLSKETLEGLRALGYIQ